MKKILLVDDDKYMLDYMQGILEDDYEVIAASNGKDGMSLLLLHNPDLVVLDLVMPYLDGYQFLDILRDKSLDPKVVILTGVPAHMRESLDSSQVLDIIVKPFKSQDFLDKIKGHIEA